VNVMGRVVILGLDGLEYNLVERFNLKTLMQLEYGETRLDGFEEPLQTPILWRSFIMGALPEGWMMKNHIFMYAEKSWAISVPGYNEWVEFQPVRAGLSRCIIEKLDPTRYLQACWDLYRKKKTITLNLLERGGWDLFMSHIFLSDLVGHWICYDNTAMYDLYREMSKLTEEVKKRMNPEDFLLIISDHGLYWDEKRYGGWGQHSNHGFYSINEKLGLKNPHLTDFYEVIIQKLRSHKKGERREA